MGQMDRHTAQKYCPTRGHTFVENLDRHAARRLCTFAPKLQVLHLDMIGLARRESSLECLISMTLIHHIRPGSTPGNSVYQAVRYPLPILAVHLEILFCHLAEIDNLLIFDYPTVTRLTVTMLANSPVVVGKVTGGPADLVYLLDLMKTPEPREC